MDTLPWSVVQPTQLHSAFLVDLWVTIFLLHWFYQQQRKKYLLIQWQVFLCFKKVIVALLLTKLKLPIHQSWNHSIRIDFHVPFFYLLLIIVDVHSSRSVEDPLLLQNQSGHLRVVGHVCVVQCWNISVRIGLETVISSFLHESSWPSLGSPEAISIWQSEM